MAEPKELYLKAGMLVIFSTGDYSDYSLRGTYVALADFTQEEALDIAKTINAHMEEQEEKEGWYDGNVHADFENALIAKGLLMAVQVTEHHIGSYGELEILK